MCGGGPSQRGGEAGWRRAAQTGSSAPSAASGAVPASHPSPPCAGPPTGATRGPPSPGLKGPVSSGSQMPQGEAKVQPLCPAGLARNPWTSAAGWFRCSAGEQMLHQRQALPALPCEVTVLARVLQRNRTSGTEGDSSRGIGLYNYVAEESRWPPSGCRSPGAGAEAQSTSRA